MIYRTLTAVFTPILAALLLAGNTSERSISQREHNSATPHYEASQYAAENAPTDENKKTTSDEHKPSNEEQTKPEKQKKDGASEDKKEPLERPSEGKCGTGKCGSGR